VPLRFIPISTAARLILTPSEMHALASSGPAGRYLSQRSGTWLRFWNFFGRTGGGVVFDALAILAAVRPDLIYFQNAAAQVDPSGNLVARPDNSAAGRIRISTGYENAAKEFMVGRLRQKD
jgi:inosine-uridine nucleoside N-ribohydrolase